MRLPGFIRRLPVTPGATVMVLLMAFFGLGQLTGLCPLYEYLALDPSAVWRGEIWRLFTFALMPASPIDLIMGGWSIIWLGAWLERIWKPLECWLYGGICTVTAGVVVCLLFPRFDGQLAGSAIAVIALLVAWGRLCGHERLLVAQSWETTGRTVALAWGTVILLVAWFSCGRWIVLPLVVASAITGWVYLSARWRLHHRKSARQAGGQRMSRLEL